MAGEGSPPPPKTPVAVNDPPRRPLAARQQTWAVSLARALTRAGATPNAISVASFFFALAAATALAFTAQAGGISRILLLLAAAACIQLRLICNLIDGMVAIEGGRRTSYGEVFNDVPDRFSDVVIFVAAGYSLTAFGWGRELGWLAATLAVLTAYVRLLGGSMGVHQYFIGPMAKQHRMATLTVACILSTLEPLAGWRGQTIAAALAIVIAGSLITFFRRTARIVADCKAR
jgi:phosphatidylglycerophosphate synthase